MPDDQSSQTEEIMGPGYQNTRSSSPAPSGDAYSELLGESGGNALSRFSRRALAVQSGLDLQVAHERHQQRMHEQDLLFQLATGAAEQGISLSPEAGKYYKSIGGDPQLLDVVGGIAKSKKQEQEQQIQQLRSIFGLDQDPPAGAGGGGGAPTTPPGTTSPAGVTPASTGGGPGPNAGKHWGDPGFNWEYYIQNEPPELKAMDKQLRQATFNLAAAAIRKQPTQGLQKMVDALKEQHHQMLESYLGFAKQGEQHQFQEAQQARGEAFQQAQQGRSEAFQQTQQARSFQHSDEFQKTKDDHERQKQIEKLNARHETLMKQWRTLQGKKYEDTEEGRQLRIQEAAAFNQQKQQFEMDNADSGTKIQAIPDLTVKSTTTGGIDLPLYGKVGAKHVDLTVPDKSGDADSAPPPDAVSKIKDKSGKVTGYRLKDGSIKRITNG